MKRFFIHIVFLFSICGANAQSLSNLRAKNISVLSDSVLIDSFSIVPNSLFITDESGKALDSSTYNFYPFQSLIVFRQRKVNTIFVRYRVMAMSLAKHYSHKSFQQYLKTKDRFVLDPYNYTPDETTADKLIDFGTLDYSGVFSRGLSFGNNQSVTLNSLFNIQMQGMIAKDLEVTAAITDNNIPIQPEGNTQQIQEFDKIFVQLRKDKHTVIVGDFDMNNPETYFLKYTKKAQGGSYTGRVDFKNASSLKITLGGGINKGKFARNYLSASEGNQGPYKLIGTNNEAFIIILANSEEVFINGQKLTRGADKDYVIDYNLGTITFTPRRIITKDLRIMVEFEYSERYFQRSMINGNIEWLSKKVDVRLNAYSEQDSKNQNVQQTLDANKKSFLASIGDSVSKAYYKGYDSVSFDANRVLYQKVDTLIINGLDTIHFYFKYSTDPSKAFYSVNFTYVGEGKGLYASSINTANGRVYEWKLGGAYLPVIQLVTPRIAQVFSLATDFKISENTNLTAEGAISNNDPNTFSSIDNQNHLGGAARMGFKTKINVRKDSLSAKEFILINTNYEYVNKKYRSIERYRSAEFSRDFNLPTITTQTFNEHYALASLSYNWRNVGSLNYRFRTLIQDSLYQGMESFFQAILFWKNIQFTSGSSFLNSTGLTSKSSFIRPKGDLNYTIHHTKGWKIGLSFDNEINKLTYKNTDTLNAPFSHIWQNYKFYVQSPDSLLNKYKLEYIVRIEQDPVKNSFGKPRLIAHTINATGSVFTIKNQQLNWTLTYRRVDERDSVRASLELKNYYLGRVDYSLTALKGFLRYNTLYEVGAGREQKTQLVYLSSPTNSQGDYIWKDLNGNGIKEVNEFVTAQNRAANDTLYVRTFLVTPDFFPVNSTAFNQVLQLNPAALVKSTKGFAGFIGRFSIMSSVQLTKKIYASKQNKTASYFNPFPTERAMDTSIVALTVSNRNSIFFNRVSTKFSAQFDLNYINTKTLLTSGYENKNSFIQLLTTRWNIIKTLSWQSTFTHAEKSNNSDFYKTQQFKIQSFETSQDMSYLIGTFLRLGLIYNFANKQNTMTVNGGQKSILHQLSAEGKFNRTDKTTVFLKVSYATVKYNNHDNQNQQAEYAMLDGLKNGNNYIWEATIEQKLSNSIQLLLGYDGRKIGTGNIVHNGRAEIRAVF